MDSRRDFKRVLVLGDAGTCATGFATVLRNVLFYLAKAGYDIDQIAVNFFGDFYSTEKHPYRLYPACPLGAQDLFGRPRLIQALLGKDRSIHPPYHILFTLQDPFIIEPIAKNIKEIQEAYAKKGLSFKWISYTPVDCALKENWVRDAIMLADYPVVYTDYGKRACEYHDLKGDLKVKERVKVIPHGINPDDFYPLEKKQIKEFRQNYFKGMVREETFLIVRVDRNQPRKDFARTMKVFKEFQRLRPDSFLYLHAKQQDAGGSISEIARQFDLKPNEDYTLPANFDENVGVPLPILNMIYNAADCVLSTTLGEGFGLTITEPMRCKTPVLAPNITSIPEIFNTERMVGQELIENIWPESERGIAIRAENTNSEWFCMGLTDNERLRPLTNVEDCIKKLVWIYDNEDKAAQIADNAYKWISEMTWEEVCKDWIKLFDCAYLEVMKERKKFACLAKKGVVR